MTILLLGRYQFPISTEFSKNEYCPNAIFEYLPNIVIVYFPNNRSIIFATWVESGSSEVAKCRSDILRNK